MEILPVNLTADWKVEMSRIINFSTQGEPILRTPNDSPENVEWTINIRPGQQEFIKAERIIELGCWCCTIYIPSLDKLEAAIEKGKKELLIAKALKREISLIDSDN